MPIATLSAKERSLFTQVVRNYETKSYKKGIKAADQILRKYPDHGDTQAMKALIINSQGNTDEAFALAKVALKNEMKSHICWHVYGLLYRSVKNFEEAIKAYKFALKLEPQSIQIQKDLALLQMQMRDYQGYIQSRRAILQGKSGVRSNWTALAIAQHLAGDLKDAELTLSTYEETLRGPPSRSDVEHSEAVLYKNTIIAEMGETERALDHLEAVTKGNLDRTAVMEMRAQYLFQLGRKDDAAKAYRALLERNTENRAYYDGLERALDLTRSDIEPLKAMYSEYAQKNPRGDAAKRIPLEFLHDDDFREAADQYLQHMFRKEVPSTFANVKALYSDAAKRDIMQSLAEGHAAKASSSQPNGTDEKSVNGDTSHFETSAKYFLAQHYNYHRSRDLEKATSWIDEAIQSLPESVDYHMTKARIWKHRGSPSKASEAMEKARSLDPRDRYIYSKAAKYQLRNEENEAALQTMSKFTRNDAVGGTLGDLIDMQCMWFINEDGESYLRQKKLGLALKRFSTAFSIFEIWQEDQFEFHAFSLKKGQIRAYVDMVRWEDHLRDHPFFTRAAVGAIRAYLMLYDQPSLSDQSLLNGLDGKLDRLEISERKKAQKKARKEQQKQEHAEAEKKDAKKTAGVVDGEVKKPDPDPNGTKLLESKQPLEDAMKFLTPLLESSPRNILAQQIGFEVFFRRRKFLLALRCLLASRSISTADSKAHEQLVRLRHTLNRLPEPLESNLSTVIEAELSSLLPPDTDLSAFNDEFSKTHAISAPHIQAYIKARRLLGNGSDVQDGKDVLSLLQLDAISLEDAVQGYGLLKAWSIDPTLQENYLTKARDKWPEADVFTTTSPQ